MTTFDDVFTRGRITATKLLGKAKAVLVTITGYQTDPDDPSALERSDDEVLYGAIGVVARPRPADATGASETICARTDDGLTPIAGRDTRLNANVNPKEGEVDVVAYGGAFVSLADSSDGPTRGGQVVIYSPAKDGGGAVTKAHTIMLDPSGDGSLAIVHGDGMAITMQGGGKHAMVLKNKAGDACILIDDDGITLNGNVKLNGAVVGGSVEAAQPVALAPAIAAWAAQVVSACAAASPPITVPPLPPTVAATMVSGS